MPRQVTWPDIASAQILGIDVFYPGELLSESAYTAQRSTILRGRRLYRGSVLIAQRKATADAQQIEAFVHAISEGNTYFDLPIHRDGFAEDGATVGTSNADGEIEVATVTATGFTLKQRRNGAAADAVNGNLKRNPKSGDYFKIGDRLFEFGDISPAATNNPEYALDSEQLRDIEVGDKITEAKTLRVRLDGEPPASVRGRSDSTGWEGWSFDWVEYVAPIGIPDDDAPSLIGSIRDYNGIIGEDVEIQLRNLWVNASGNNTDADLSWEYEVIGNDATGKISGSKITLRCIRRGNVVVRAWARDVRTGRISAPVGFLVRINALGDSVPPAVSSSIPLMSLRIGEQDFVNKKVHFGNLEGLTYRLTIADPTVAHVDTSDEAEIATITGVASGVTHGYLIGVSPTGGAQLIIWEIVVAGVLRGAVGGQAPATGAITQLIDFPSVSLQATVDDANPRYVRMDVTEYISVTNDPASYIPVDVIDPDTNQKITTSRMEGNKLRIESRKVNDLTGTYPLTSTVNLLVRDAAGKERTFTIQTEVTAAGNQAPVWQGNKRIILGTTANSRVVTFDLKSATSGYAYTYDPDDDDEVTVTLTGTGLGSSDITRFTATLAGSTVTVTRVLADGQSYEGTLTVRATDDDAVPLSTDFVFDVHIWSNLEPSVTASSWDATELPTQPWNIPFDAEATHSLRSVDVTDALTSGDTTPSVVSSDTSIVRASFSGKTLSLTPVGIGAFTLTLSVQSQADDAPVTLTINGAITEPGSVTLGTWNGPGASELNGVVGNTFDIYPDDYYQVPADAQAAGVKVGYTAFIARGDTAYASLDKASISNTATGRANRKFVLSYDDATPTGETVSIYIYAIYSKINRNNVRHAARFTVTAAAEPTQPDAGPVVTQLPNLPAAGATLYANDTFDVDFSEGFSAGETGVAINWETLDVSITGAQRANLSMNSESPVRTFTCVGSTTVPVTVRARVQDNNGVWSEYQSFTVTITALPVAAAPEWVDRALRYTIPVTPNQFDIALNELCSYSGTGGLAGVRFGVINSTPPSGNYQFVGNGTTNPRFRIFRGTAPSLAIRYVLTATVTANTRIYRPKAINVVFAFSA